jgi:uncharacterized membrane protein
MFKRLVRHLLFAPSLRKAFPRESFSRIRAAIAAGELRHNGQVVFAVKPALSFTKILRHIPVRACAEEAFTQLRVWDTEANCGVLIYLLLADRRLEIVADRGLNGKVSTEQWREVCLTMEQYLSDGKPEEAAIRGVDAVADLLARNFPATSGESKVNELPDHPRVL